MMIAQQWKSNPAMDNHCVLSDMQYLSLITVRQLLSHWPRLRMSIAGDQLQTPDQLTRGLYYEASSTCPGYFLVSGLH